MSFSSLVNFGRSMLERYASISSSEQLLLFWKRFFRCVAAIEHISLCTLVKLLLASLRKGIALETDLDQFLCKRVENCMICAILDLVSGLGCDSFSRSRAWSIDLFDRRASDLMSCIRLSRLELLQSLRSSMYLLQMSLELLQKSASFQTRDGINASDYFACIWGDALDF